MVTEQNVNYEHQLTALKIRIEDLESQLEDKSLENLEIKIQLEKGKEKVASKD